VGAIQRVIGKRNAAVQAKIPVTVDVGFHVNSNTPSEDYLIPLKVTWTSKGVLEGGDLVYPKPAMMKVGGADKPLSVFEGSFSIQADFKVAANAPAGPGAASGKLSYQACNDKMCFPPKTVEISVPYQVN
jgi:DsbC/DsbD-like thiol-disulfide interchange protein